jgi:hypothetical protein
MVLVSSKSEAEQSFTLAMKDPARKEWNDQFNGAIAEPFKKGIAVCVAGSEMDLKLGNGCVEAASADICCDRWKIALECSSKGAWEQESIRGTACTEKPRKDDD